MVNSIQYRFVFKDNMYCEANQQENLNSFVILLQTTDISA